MVVEGSAPEQRAAMRRDTRVYPAATDQLCVRG